MMMAMVLPKSSWLVPRMTQKAAPRDMQIHSHHNRPRMPHCLAHQSEMKPPAHQDEPAVSIGESWTSSKTADTAAGGREAQSSLSMAAR